MAVYSKENCMFCHKSKDEKGELKPIYDWNNGKLIGYYCQTHYLEVIAFQNKQKSAYERFINNLKD